MQIALIEHSSSPCVQKCPQTVYHNLCTHGKSRARSKRSAQRFSLAAVFVHTEACINRFACSATHRWQRYVLFARPFKERQHTDPRLPAKPDLGCTDPRPPAKPDLARGREAPPAVCREAPPALCRESNPSVACMHLPLKGCPVICLVCRRLALRRGHPVICGFAVLVFRSSGHGW